MQGGIYVLTLMDWYSGSYNLMIVSLCELVAVCYVYGKSISTSTIQTLWQSLHVVKEVKEQRLQNVFIQ